MASALTEAQQAQQAWHQALKMRKHLSKQIDKLRADSASGTDIAQFDAIDEVLTEFRFACVTTIFLDFEYAVAESTEEVLWQLHSTINGEYRRLLSKLRADSRVVEKRKVETKYGHFLRIAQKFYKGYIQRLAARYDIPELKRVARGIEAEEMSAKDVISPDSADLYDKVLTSCHSTLIRLGDLARYRVQAKHKKSYDMALAFYSLGHDLMPESGFAFHQMGIVNIEEGNHLDVIYHFYRAWAVKKPHPMAKQNLENKFKSLSNHNSAQRGKPSPPSTHETFVLWFLRLQALFYKGEPVSAQHHELEREVMHRLAMAAKEGTCPDILLKMSLVNISACTIASAKTKESKTEATSRFYHYTLHFNARFILKICEVIEATLREPGALDPADSADQGEANVKSALLGALLPVLRVYCIWIATCRSEIIGASDATANVVPPLAQSLAKVLTLLCAEVYTTSTSPASCPYLLPEDIEIRGLSTFSGERVPEPCRGYCTEDGTLKPHLDLQQQRFSTAQESMARILDILRCGYFLAEDQVMPISCGVVDNLLAFQYRPHSDNAAVPDKLEPSQMMPAASQQPAGSSTVGIENGLDQIQAAPQVHVQQPDRDLDSRHMPRKSNPPPIGNHLETMDAFDETVANVLSPFMDCPSPKSEQNARSPDEPSYGMHSTTANEVAQELLMSFQREPREPAPYYESWTPGNFGSSTWNNYFTPTPPKAQESGSANRSGVSSHQRHSLNSSRGSVTMGESLGDPFVTPGRPGAGTLPPPLNSSSGSPRVPSGGLQPGNPTFQSFGGAAWGAQRPVSGSWSQSTKQTPIGQMPSTNSGSSYYPPGLAPSSNASAFSHPSSLYQGTPADFHATHGGNAYGNLGTTQAPNGTAGPSSSRHLRMENTASSYDAAVLQSAYEGHK